MSALDLKLIRKAAGLTAKQAGDFVHVAESTWLNWERNGWVTPNRAEQVKRRMRVALTRHIDHIESVINGLES